VPLSSKPYTDGDEWERGWHQAQAEAKAKDEAQEQAARAETLRIQSERQKQQVMNDARTRLRMAEEHLHDIGFYKSYEYSKFAKEAKVILATFDDLESRRYPNGPGSEELQVREMLTDDYSTRLSRAKYEAIKQFLYTIGIQSESEWLNMCRLAGENNLK
jgi:hypothetical protein